MLALSFKTFSKDVKNHAVYLLFLTFWTASITLVANLVMMETSYIQQSATQFDIQDPTAMSNELFAFVVFILLILLGFYAFQFYLNNQSKLLSVFRISGTSFYKIVFFMFTQLIIIFSVSAIIGFFLGNFLFNQLNSFVQSMNGGIVSHWSVSVNAMLFVGAMIGFELFFLLLIMWGFIYRNGINELLRFEANFDPQKSINQKMINKKLQLYVFILMLVAYFSIIVFTKNDRLIFLSSIVITVAIFPIFLRNWKVSIFHKLKIKMEDTNNYLGISLLSFHLNKLLKYLQFFSILLVVTAGLVVNAAGIYEDFIFYYSVYMIFCLIFLFTIFYQLMLNLESSEHDFTQLIRLGKTKQELKRIIHVEMSGFYLSLFMVVFAIPTVIFIKAMAGGTTPSIFMLVLLLLILSIFVIFYYFSKKTYYTMIKEM